MTNKVWVVFWLPYGQQTADIKVCANEEAMLREAAKLLRDRIELIPFRRWTPSVRGDIDILLQRDQIREALDLWASHSLDLIYLHEREVHV